MMTKSYLYYLARIGGTLRTGEVAELLGITPAEVRRSGKLIDGLKPISDGRKTRSYLASDVKSYLDKRTRDKRTN